MAGTYPMGDLTGGQMPLPPVQRGRPRRPEDMLQEQMQANLYPPTPQMPTDARQAQYQSSPMAQRLAEDQLGVGTPQIAPQMSLDVGQPQMPPQMGLDVGVPQMGPPGSEWTS